MLSLSKKHFLTSFFKLSILCVNKHIHKEEITFHVDYIAPFAGEWTVSERLHPSNEDADLLGEKFTMGAKAKYVAAIELDVKKSV